MFKIDPKEIIDLTCSLVRKDTTNPPGNEYRVKDIIIKSMKRIGARVRLYGRKSRPTILGEIGKGHPSVAIIAHMDVVPAGEGWRSNPFIPLVKGGKIYGRGVLDNKGPYAASWAAVKAIVEAKLPIKGGIILGAVADEERGSEEGVKVLLREGWRADFCLIPDGGRINEAIIGEKGTLWLSLEARGRQAHGSKPQLGINAIENLSKFLLRLKGCNFGKYDKRFTKPTINLGEIRGGDAPNIVPGRCEATLDIRYPLGISKRDILKRVEEEIHLFKEKDPKANIRIREVAMEARPHLVDRDSKIVRAFLSASRRLKHKIALKTSGGNTIAKDLHFAGIPSLSHCPEEGSMAHRANEWVRISNLVKCARLHSIFIYELVR